MIKLLIPVIALVGSIISLIITIRAKRNIDRIWAEIKGDLNGEIVGSGDCPPDFYECEKCHGHNIRWTTGRCPDCDWINSECPYKKAERFHFSAIDPRKKHGKAS